MAGYASIFRGTGVLVSAGPEADFLEAPVAEAALSMPAELCRISLGKGRSYVLFQRDQTHSDIIYCLKGGFSKLGRSEARSVLNLLRLLFWQWVEKSTDKTVESLLESESLLTSLGKAVSDTLVPFQETATPDTSPQSTLAASQQGAVKYPVNHFRRGAEKKPQVEDILAFEDEEADLAWEEEEKKKRKERNKLLRLKSSVTDLQIPSGASGSSSDSSPASESASAPASAAPHPVLPTKPLAAMPYGCLPLGASPVDSPLGSPAVRTTLNVLAEEVTLADAAEVGKVNPPSRFAAESAAKSAAPVWSPEEEAVQRAVSSGGIPTFAAQRTLTGPEGQALAGREANGSCSVDAQARLASASAPLRARFFRQSSTDSGVRDGPGTPLFSGLPRWGDDGGVVGPVPLMENEEPSTGVSSGALTPLYDGLYEVSKVGREVAAGNGPEQQRQGPGQAVTGKASPRTLLMVDIAELHQELHPADLAFVKAGTQGVPPGLQVAERLFGPPSRGAEVMQQAVSTSDPVLHSDEDVLDYLKIGTPTFSMESPSPGGPGFGSVPTLSRENSETSSHCSKQGKKGVTRMLMSKTPGLRILLKRASTSEVERGEGVELPGCASEPRSTSRKSMSLMMPRSMKPPGSSSSLAKRPEDAVLKAAAKLASAEGMGAMRNWDDLQIEHYDSTATPPGKEDPAADVGWNSLAIGQSGQVEWLQAPIVPEQEVSAGNRRKSFSLLSPKHPSNALNIFSKTKGTGMASAPSCPNLTPTHETSAANQRVTAATAGTAAALPLSRFPDLDAEVFPPVGAVTVASSSRQASGVASMPQSRFPEFLPASQTNSQEQSAGSRGKQQRSTNRDEPFDWDAYLNSGKQGETGGGVPGSVASGLKVAVFEEHGTHGAGLMEHQGTGTAYSPFLAFGKGTTGPGGSRKSFTASSSTGAVSDEQELPRASVVNKESSADQNAQCPSTGHANTTDETKNFAFMGASAKAFASPLPGASQRRSSFTVMRSTPAQESDASAPESRRRRSFVVARAELLGGVMDGRGGGEPWGGGHRSAGDGDTWHGSG